MLCYVVMHQAYSIVHHDIASSVAYSILYGGGSGRWRGQSNKE